MPSTGVGVGVGVGLGVGVGPPGVGVGFVVVGVGVGDVVAPYMAFTVFAAMSWLTPALSGYSRYVTPTSLGCMLRVVEPVVNTVKVIVVATPGVFVFSFGAPDGTMIEDSVKVPAGF